MLVYQRVLNMRCFHGHPHVFIHSRPQLSTPNLSKHLQHRAADWTQNSSLQLFEHWWYSPHTATRGDIIYIYTSSTRTRRGGSCLKDIYETFLIYRTCMRRAPAKPVRACTLRKLCPASHVTLEAPRHTSHLTVFTLHTAPFAVNTSHFSLHTALSPIHTSHSTLHSPHFTLLTSHFTLHTSHCTLHAPHFTLHSSHSTLHLIWALLTLSQLISSHLISSHMSSKLSWITSQYFY